MLKLSVQANLSQHSNVRTICLPFIAFNYPQSTHENTDDNNDDDLIDAIPLRDTNLLRNIKLNINRTKIQRKSKKNARRRNDKFLHNYFSTDIEGKSKYLQVINISTLNF